jgi:hypothetical protein
MAGANDAGITGKSICYWLTARILRNLLVKRLRNLLLDRDTPRKSPRQRSLPKLASPPLSDYNTGFSIGARCGVQR